MSTPIYSAVTLLRREDLLNLKLRFQNVSVDDESGVPMLLPTDRGKESYVEVTFPPQAVFEQALAANEAIPGVLGARFSGLTALAFSIGPHLPIPFMATDLLAMLNAAKVVDAALEVVWDLRFRLAGAMTVGAWTHVVAPVPSTAGVTELWHTRLTRPVRLGSAPTSAATTTFEGSLTGAQRRSISAAIERSPVTANELTLSPMGATIDLVGDWAGLADVSVLGYRHRAVLGRDTSVSVTQRGYLFPFGYPALLTTNTERRLEAGQARLRRTYVLALQATVVDMQNAVGIPRDGREFPFRTVRVAGPLRAEVGLQALATGVDWINAPTGERLAFHFTAEDYGGRAISFSAPVAFVVRDRAFGSLAEAVAGYDRDRAGVPIPAAGRLALAKDAPTETVVDVTAIYLGAAQSPAGTSVLQAAGRLAAFPRLTQVDARIPALEAFTAAAGSSLAGRADRPPAKLLLDEVYLQAGSAGSKVYAKLKEQVPFEPPVTNAGGLAKLALPVSGLSRGAGLVGGDLAAFRQGGFDPAKYFKPDASLPNLLPPKLLGFLSLPDLVERAGDGEAVPRVATEVSYPQGDHRKPPESVRSVVTWRPKMRQGLHFGMLRITAKTTLELHSVNVVDLRGRPPISDNRAELRSFEMAFGGGILNIAVERLAFTAQSGSPPSLAVKITDVRFDKNLQFLDKLRGFLPSPANGPRISVTPAGIEAGYTLAIPSVSLGVFLLQNLTLSAQVTLPLGSVLPAVPAGPGSAAALPAAGPMAALPAARPAVALAAADPPAALPVARPAAALPSVGPAAAAVEGKSVRMKFEVSSREHPFLVTVSAFGGGGFVALTVEGASIVELEASLEFGAAVALNLGVASASVSITAGVYLRLQAGGAVFEGFLRAVGELDVLGLVHVSVEVLLKLGYCVETVQKAGVGTVTRRFVYGKAMVTLRVRVLFFSQSVTVAMERRFSDGSDPSFDLAFPTRDLWRRRCSGYAPMVSS